jgi:hypothetical protein
MNLKRSDIRYLDGNEIMPCNLHKTEVEQYAENVAEQCEFNIGDDPSALAIQLGASIHFEDIPNMVNGETTGSIFVHATNEFDICLPTYTSVVTQ